MHDIPFIQKEYSATNVLDTECGGIRNGLTSDIVANSEFEYSKAKAHPGWCSGYLNNTTRPVADKEAVSN